jgi:pimeloyl-ACP methyl ester carboxylesterase
MTIEPLAAAGFLVIVPDQRGYNEADKPPGVESYRVDELALDVTNLTEVLGYSKADADAYDWGGGVAIDSIAVQAPFETQC